MLTYAATPGPVIPSSAPRARRVEGDLAALCVGLKRVVGNRLLSILAVGSVGRAHTEGGMASRLAVEDYDLIIVLTRLETLQRLLLRRRVARLLAQHAQEVAVPVSVGFVSQSALAALPFTLFNYEMRNAHRVLEGPDPTSDMPAYDAVALPLIEATRLLLNRGVLLWGDLLQLRGGHVSKPELRAIALRNRKAAMALGDALLILCGAYHWSYRERADRARACSAFDGLESLDLRNRYLAAIARKLAGAPPAVNVSMLRSEISALLAAHEGVFRVLEEARLGRKLVNWQHYAEHPLGYPRYLLPAFVKRTVHLLKAFGPPRGNGFLRAYFHRCVEEILLQGFPLFAYTGTNSAPLLRRYLNWPRGLSQDPLTVWRRVSRAWATTQ